MGSSRGIKQITANENLLMIGIVLAILGYYVIAEWQIIGGLLIVFSGYAILVIPTKIVSQLYHFLVFRFQILKKRFFDISVNSST